MVDNDQEESDEEKEPEVPRIPETPTLGLAATVAALADTLNTVGGLGARIQSLLSPQIQSFAGVGKAFADMNRSNAKALHDLTVVIRETMSTFDRIKPIDTLASKYGWPPIWAFGPRDYIGLVQKAKGIEDEEERRKYVDEYIVGCFQNDELERLISDWRTKSFLRDRLPIIEDAFTAYQERKYSIAVPAILAQTEGLFFQWILKGDDEENSEKGKWNDSVTGKHYRDLLEKLKEENGEDSITVMVYEGLNAFVSDFGLYRTKDEKDAGYRDPLAYAISRNKILHGASIDYYKKPEISLRHLLWLDCVIQLIDTVLRAEEKQEGGGLP